jgi:hypothetical protein
VWTTPLGTGVTVLSASEVLVGLGLVVWAVVDMAGTTWLVGTIVLTFVGGIGGIGGIGGVGGVASGPLTSGEQSAVGHRRGYLERAVARGRSLV